MDGTPTSDIVALLRRVGSPLHELAASRLEQQERIMGVMSKMLNELDAELSKYEHHDHELALAWEREREME